MIPPKQIYRCALCYENMEITHKVEWLQGRRVRLWECPRCAHSSPIRKTQGSYYYEPW